MRVRVDRSKCSGYTICEHTAPMFKIDEAGYAFVEDETVPVEFEQQVRQAARACPERAILIEE